nr:hypothetical protein [Tanacetum cinerariifolium]
MPPRADLSFAVLDDSVFNSKVSETITSVSKIETNASKTSKDSLEKPKTVRSSASIIEDWESDSEDKMCLSLKKPKAVVSAGEGNRNNDVKSSACNVDSQGRLNTMASAIICLANNQKFNFSKYIFDNMVKNLEAGVKFFTFPRFVQVFMNHQVENKRVFWIITPLFKTMMVQAPKEMDEGAEVPTNSHHTPIVTQPSSSQPQKKQISRRKQRQKLSTMASAIICLANNQKFNFSKYIFDNMVKNLEAGVKFFTFPRFVQVFMNHQVEEAKIKEETKAETEVPHTKRQTKESVPTTSNDPLPSGEDRMQLTELMNLFTHLQKQVLDLEKAKTAQAKEIADLKKRV